MILQHFLISIAISLIILNCTVYKYCKKGCILRKTKRIRWFFFVNLISFLPVLNIVVTTFAITSLTMHNRRGPRNWSCFAKPDDAPIEHTERWTSEGLEEAYDGVLKEPIPPEVEDISESDVSVPIDEPHVFHVPPGWDEIRNEQWKELIKEWEWKESKPEVLIPITDRSEILDL